MPGSHDPTSVALPQQPIHLALFDSAKAYSQSTLESLTNPSWWDIDGIKVFGTSGQNVDDVYKYVDDDHIEGGRIGLLENMLRWRHVAPTAPDTLCSVASPFLSLINRVLSFSGSRSVCVGRDAAYILCWKSTSVRHATRPRYHASGSGDANEQVRTDNK